MSKQLSFSYENTKYSFIRGTRIRTFDDGTVGTWLNSAALDSENNMTTFSYKYIF